MKRELLLSIFMAFMTASAGSFCYGDEVWACVGSDFCYDCLTMHWIWEKFVYTTTYPWATYPECYEESDKTIPDDRLCRSENSGTESIGFKVSEGYSQQYAHSWTTTMGIAVTTGLEISGSCTNGSSWGCSLTTEESETRNVAYETPKGELGHHKVAWEVSGYHNEGELYQGTYLEGPPSSASTLAHDSQLTCIDGSAVTENKWRSIYASAGDWVSLSKECKASRGGCGLDDVCCDYDNGSGEGCVNPYCCHYIED